MISPPSSITMLDLHGESEIKTGWRSYVMNEQTKLYTHGNYKEISQTCAFSINDPYVICFAACTQLLCTVSAR
jgi:hypothetical protein